MVNFIETIKMEKMPIDWATILCDNLDEQLVSMKINPWLHMTSCMVYILAAKTTYYPCLYKKESMQDENAWPYVVYLQLVKKKLLEQSAE